jgi:hypothetical protein
MCKFEVVLEKVNDKYTGQPNGRVLALLFNRNPLTGRRSILENVAESDTAASAVAWLVKDQDLSEIGVKDSDGNVTVPDEISLSEAASAYYSIF